MSSEFRAIAELPGGFAIQADSTDLAVVQQVRELVGQVPLIVADPPYGNIVAEHWDRIEYSDELFSSWMISWTRAWAETCLLEAGAFYVWGGIGKPGFRPFLRYLSEVEQLGHFELANLITWSKKRGYGVQNNYLFTREECAYFVKGSAKRPRTFNVPYLEAKRGYAGYNKAYPARSDQYRRTNVWTDVTEILRGKQHPTQKQQRVIEVPIEVHTTQGDWVIDPFAGAGTTALACVKLNRRFVVIENDPAHFCTMVELLKTVHEGCNA